MSRRTAPVVLLPGEDIGAERALGNARSTPLAVEPGNCARGEEIEQNTERRTPEAAGPGSSARGEDSLPGDVWRHVRRQRKLTTVHCVR